MNVLLILILASLGVAVFFLVVFIWAVRSGQYEDTTTPSMRVLMEEDGGVSDHDTQRKERETAKSRSSERRIISEASH